MNQAPSTKHQDTDLPEDVVLSVRHVSKKFCRNLRRSMLYGMQDLGRNLLGIRPKAGDHRLQTIDHRPEAGDLRHETIDHRPAEGEVLRSEVPESNVYGLKSKVSSPDVQGLKSKVSLPCEAERASCEVPGVSREKFPATNQEPITTHNKAPSTKH